MLVRFENLLSKRHVTKNYSHKQIELLQTRDIWSIDDVIYWVVKVIAFESHYNILISPLYAWEKMVTDTEWTIFDVIAEDEVYAERMTDKICLRHDKTEPGISDKSGNAIYLKTYQSGLMPEVRRGDVFVFHNVAYVVSSFEVHRRIVGKNLLDRVIVVTHDVSTMFEPEKRTSIISSEYLVNPLDCFIGGIRDGQKNHTY